MRLISEEQYAAINMIISDFESVWVEHSQLPLISCDNDHDYNSCYYTSGYKMTREIIKKSINGEDWAQYEEFSVK